MNVVSWTHQLDLCYVILLIQLQMIYLTLRISKLYPSTWPHSPHFLGCKLVLNYKPTSILAHESIFKWNSGWDCAVAELCSCCMYTCCYRSRFPDRYISSQNSRSTEGSSESQPPELTWWVTTPSHTHAYNFLSSRHLSWH